MNRTWIASISTIAAASALAAPAPQAGWSTYGGDPGATRYSLLTQITPANVSQLRAAWTFRTGELGQGVKDWSRSAFEATPPPERRPPKFRHRPVRELKVHLSRQGYPCIRVEGRWVEEQAGFELGTMVSVKVDVGRLVIEPLPSDSSVVPAED